MKRLFDFCGALVALTLLFIPLVFLAFLIRLKLGSPLFFWQIRPGLHGRLFNMVKFRSMTGERSSDGSLLTDAQRLTQFGRFLRSTSLDELPELWNVLKGEMSLVGPRPLLVQYLPLYSVQEARRHEVRPGITGWAQVHGRNLLNWEDKFKLDIWYVDHQSFMLDLKILCMTVKKVFAREGISAAGEATMPPFSGSSQRKFDQ